MLISDFDNYTVYVRGFLIFRKYTLKFLGIEEHHIYNLLLNCSEK